MEWLTELPKSLFIRFFNQEDGSKADNGMYLGLKVYLTNMGLWLYIATALRKMANVEGLTHLKFREKNSIACQLINKLFTFILMYQEPIAI